MNGKVRFILGFGLFFAALWFLWDTPVVYPLKIFVVLLHEVSHAIAVMATGGRVTSITLDPYQGGATYFTGGSAVVALSAGYLGSLLWGGAMFTAARTRWIRADRVNTAIGVVVVALTVLFIRNLFGVVFGVAFGVAMVGASRRMSAKMNRRLLLTLGLTSALYAILDIKSDVLDRPELPSDAHMLAEVTGIGTTTLWGVVWIAIAIGFATWLMMKAYDEA